MGRRQELISATAFPEIVFEDSPLRPSVFSQGAANRYGGFFRRIALFTVGIVVLSAVACGGGSGSSAPGNAGGGDEAAEEVGGDAQADESQDEVAEEAEADSGGGGGSSPPGDTGGDADGDGSTPRCPAPVPAATELLANGGFEGTYTGNAPGWDTNNWGVTATYARETSGAHGGSAAQMVRVVAIPPGTGLVFKQNYTFPAGRVYQGSIWMRSPDAIDVDFVFRRAGPWY